MAKNDFQYDGWNSYTMQCSSGIMTVNSPSGSTMQCDTWLWDDVIEFAQTSAILKFYIWFRFRPHHRSRHAPVSEILSKSHRPRQKINDVMSIFKIADFSHLGFYGSSNGFCEKPNYITSYRSSIDTVALNCLVFKKIAFLHFIVKIQDGGSPPSWI